MDPEKSRVEVALAIKQMLEDWPARLEVIAYQAKTVRARYLALRKEGFDVDHALRLCLKSVEL